MNNTEEFKSFVKSLKNSTSSRFPDIDLTGNIPNSLGFNNLMLFFIMTKTSAITFVEDYTKISSEIGLTPEEAISLQEINNKLILCQRIIIQNCMQQYIAGSLMKSTIDELILSLPEIKDIETIHDFQEYLEKYNDAEKVGGGPENNLTGGGCGLICKLVITLFLIMVMTTPSESDWACGSGKDYNSATGECVVAKAPTTALATVDRSDRTLAHPSQAGGPGAIVFKDPKTGIILYNTSTASFKTSEFATAVASMPRIKSAQYNFDSAVKKFEPEKKQEIDQIFNDILKLIGLERPKKTGREFLEEIVDNFNEKALNVANTAEKSCLDVMDGIYSAGGFSGMYDLNNVSKTIDQVNKAEELFGRAEEDRLQKNIEIGAITTTGLAGTGAYIGTVMLPGVGTLTGAAIGGLVGLTTNTWNHFMGTKHALRDFEDFKGDMTRSRNPITQYDPKDKQRILEQVYGASKVYCSYAFSSQINLTESNSIEVYGTRLDYPDVHGLFSLLKENLSLKITLATGDPLKESLNMELDSLHQRLEILQTLSSKISDFSSIRAPAQLKHLLDFRENPTTLAKINTYFTEQLGVLEKLASQSKETVPLEKERAIKGAKIWRDLLEIALTKLEGEKDKLEIEKKKLYIKKLFDEVSYDQTKVVVEGWSKWLLAPVAGLGSGVGNVSGDLLYGILSGILGKFPTWALVGGGIVALSIALQGLSGPIAMFRDTVGSIWWAVKLPFKGVWWVCKMVLTPVGWIFTSLGVFVGQGVQRLASAAEPVANAAPVPGFGPRAAQPYGGPVQPAINAAVVPGFGPRAPQPYGSGGRKTRKIRKQKRRISKKRVLKNKTKKRILNARRRTKYRK